MPKYVVMDEPNSNLDEVGENALITAVQALKDNGGTVIITTHRPRLVSIVDMMLVLKSGRQVAFGTAIDMLEAVRKLQVVPIAAYGASDEYNASGADSPPETPPPVAAAAVVGRTEDAA
jgi:ABC-type protease/lipase transport system fused ATPase/permease subunit